MSKKNKKIAILGGGYIGLAAAYWLSKKGYQVKLFEKEKKLGGLAAGFKFENTTLEKFYHHIFTTDKAVINMLKELGINKHLLWYNSSVALCYNRKTYPFMTPADLLKFTPLPFIGRLRLGFVTLFFQKNKNPKNFGKTSAGNWLQKWADKKAYGIVWEPLLRGKFGKHYKNISLAWFWSRIYVRGNSKKKGETREKLGYIRGGFDVFTKALEKQLLIKRVAIFKETPIEKIENNKNNSTLYFNDKKYYNGNYVYYIGSYAPHSHRYFKEKKEKIYDEWFKLVFK